MAGPLYSGTVQSLDQDNKKELVFGSCLPTVLKRAGASFGWVAQLVRELS